MNDITAVTAAALVLSLASLPAVDQPLEGGIFAGVITTKDGTHCAVVLLNEAPAECMAWQAAMAWAKELDAELPSRQVSALLYANLKHRFEPHWYWTRERDEDGSAYAWSQYFDHGYQGYVLTSYEGRVHAVRLIPLSA